MIFYLPINSKIKKSQSSYGELVFILKNKIFENRYDFKATPGLMTCGYAFIEHTLNHGIH
jgi:hypothetical protein